MKSGEWKWGCIIGVASAGWLVFSYLLGMHSRGIGMVQVVVATGYMLVLTGFVLALSEITREEPETGFLEGVKSGALIAVVAALIAMLGQFVYLKWINPEWTSYMVSATIEHFSAMGLEPAQIEMFALHAEKTFGLASYTMQAGIGTFVMGVLFSAMIMGVIRWRQR